MGKQEFDHFLRSIPTDSAEPKELLIDWEAEKNMWLQRLSGLHESILEWLGDYRESGRVQIAFRPVQLFEDGIGSYVASEADIFVGNALVKIIPAGTALVGVKGRVDIEGPRDIVRLVLAHRGATHPQIAFRQRIYPSAADKAREEQYWIDEGLGQLLADDWVWKVSTNPPHIHYTDLTQDTFLGSLLRVIEGEDAV